MTSKWDQLKQELSGQPAAPAANAPSPAAATDKWGTLRQQLNIQPAAPDTKSQLQKAYPNTDFSKQTISAPKPNTPQTYVGGNSWESKVTAGVQTGASWLGSKIGQIPVVGDYMKATGSSIKESLGQATERLGDMFEVWFSGIGGTKLSTYQKAPTSSPESRKKYIDEAPKVTGAEMAGKTGLAALSVAMNVPNPITGMVPVSVISSQIEAGKTLPGVASVPSKVVGKGFDILNTALGGAGVEFVNQTADALPLDDNQKNDIKANLAPLAGETAAFFGTLGLIHSITKGSTYAKQGITKLPVNEGVKTGLSGAADITGAAAQFGMSPVTTTFNLFRGKLFTKIQERQSQGTPIDANESKKIISETIKEIPIEDTPEIKDVTDFARARLEDLKRKAKGTEVYDSSTGKSRKIPGENLTANEINEINFLKNNTDPAKIARQYGIPLEPVMKVGPVEIHTRQPLVLENLMRDQEDLAYTKVDTLGKDLNGNPIAADFTWDYKNQKGTIRYTEDTTAEEIAHELGHYVDHTAGAPNKARLTDLIPTVDENPAAVTRSLTGYIMSGRQRKPGDLAMQKAVIKTTKMINQAVDALTKGSDKYVSERFADAVREMIKSPEAQKKFPEFYDFVDYYLNSGRKDPITATVKKAGGKKKGATVINPDIFKEKYKDFADENHPKYSKMAKEQYTAELKTNKNDLVKFTGGGPGSGKSEIVLENITKGFNGIVVDGTLADYSSTVKKINQATNAGKRVEFNVILPRIQSAWKFVQKRYILTDRDVPLEKFANLHAGFIKTLESLVQNGYVVNLKDTRDIFSLTEAKKTPYINDPAKILDILSQVRYDEGELVSELKNVKLSEKSKRKALAAREMDRWAEKGIPGSGEQVRPGTSGSPAKMAPGQRTGQRITPAEKSDVSLRLEKEAGFLLRQKAAEFVAGKSVKLRTPEENPEKFRRPKNTATNPKNNDPIETAKKLGFRDWQESGVDGTPNEAREMAEQFWAKTEQPGIYYHLGPEKISGKFDVNKTRYNPAARRGVSMINGMYLSTDPKAIKEFYGMDMESVTTKAYGNPRWLDLMDRNSETKFLSEVEEKYSVKDGAPEFGRAIAKELTARGYDGIKYFDPWATGEEYVLVNTAAVSHKPGGEEPFRIKDDFAKIGIKIDDSQETKIKELNKKFFGNEDVKFVEQILTPDGQEALGAYKDAMIRVLRGQGNAKDTYLHEAVHKYLDVVSSADEHVDLLMAGREKYKIDDFAQIEERIAEDFIDYAKTREGITGKLKLAFDSILMRIERFFGNEDKVKALYTDIMSGQAAKTATRTEMAPEVGREATSTAIPAPVPTREEITTSKTPFEPTFESFEPTKQEPIKQTKAKLTAGTGLDTGKRVGTKSYNPEKFNTSQDIEKLFKDISASGGEFAEQRISKSNEDIQRLSRMVNISVEDLLKTKPGSIANAETVRRAVELSMDCVQDLRDYTRTINEYSPTQEQLATVKKKLLRTMGVMKVVSGFRTEASNIFRSFNIDKTSSENAIIQETLVELKKIDAEAAGDLEAYAKKTKELMEPTNIDKAWHLWYASILSGASTQVKNFAGNLFNLMGELAVEGVTNPKGFNDAAKGLWNGLALGKKEFARIMREGQTNKFEERGVKPIVFTLGAEKATGWQKTARERAAWILNRADYVGRFMAATDAYFREGFYGMEMRSMAREQMQKKGYVGGGLKQRIDEYIANPEDNAANQVMEYALRGTYNNKPNGVVGAIANGLGGIVRGIEKISESAKEWKNPYAKYGTLAVTMPAGIFARMVLPFTRVVANVTNVSLDWTPLGFSRTLDPKMTSRQRKQEFGRSFIGTAAMFYLGNMAAQGMLSGTGPTDSKKKQQLKDSGWQPNSIKIGEKWFPYQNWGPMALPMTLVGNYFDHARYNDAGEGDLAARLTIATLGSARSIVDMSFLSGVSGLSSAMENMDRGGERYFQNFAAQQVSSVVPNLVKQTARYFDPTQYETTDIKSQILSNMRITTGLKPRLNVFGQPIKGTALTQLQPTDVTKDATIRFLAENKIWITVPSKSTKIRPTKEFAKLPKGGRQMSEDEYYNYVKYSGIEIKKRLDKMLPRLEKMTSEAREKEIDNIVQDVREATKRGMEMGLIK